jgi:2-keto-4-pentenoate hydratase
MKEMAMRLSPAQLQEASSLLVERWRTGERLAGLPESLRPETRAEGYAIQALIEAVSARPLFGWKIAATSLAGQAHIGVDGPLAGRLIAERVVESGAVLSLERNQMRVAEAEFAFIFARDVPPRAAAYGVEEILDAVGAMHLAIEVPDSRYADFATVGAPQLIADSACAHDFVLGAAAPPQWRSTDLARHRVLGSVGGKLHEGLGANVLGDPRIALAWIVNELSGLGIALRAGQLVTTGTCVTPMPVEPGDAVHADFGEFGTVAVGFAA